MGSKSCVEVQECRENGTPPASGSLDQMSRIQLATSGGGECARTGMSMRAVWAKVVSAIESMIETDTNPISNCWPESLLLTSGGEIGPVLFFETAQQALFAQQFGLHAS
jgi:hypothetical protein